MRVCREVEQDGDHTSDIARKISELIKNLPDNMLEDLEEVRLRISRAVEVSTRGVPHFLPYIFTKE